ncbi:MAG: hypothetical protein KC609_20575, partial [Myxococcales bacterium]|nr:hypothetical protein [Myxococcales bacterium]
MSGADTHDHNQPIPIEPDLPSSRSLVFWIGSTVIVIVICCIALWRVLESGTRAEIERKTVKTKSPELVAITKNASTWLATGGRSFAYYETAMKVMLEKKWLKGDRADRVKALDPVSQALALRTILGENKAIAMLVDREVKRRIKSTRRVSIDHVISQTLRQPSLLDPLPAPPKTTPT